MGTMEILSEINKLPVSQRLSLIELSIKKIWEDEKKGQIRVAAKKLYIDYLSDRDLVTDIDYEDFYETRKSG